MAESGGAADWWSVPGQTCVAAYKAIGATDLAASYVNLANPGTYNAAPGTAPGLAAGGWVFDGLGQWLATGILASSIESIAVRFSGFTGSTASYLLGSHSGSNIFAIYPLYLGGSGYYQIGDGYSEVTGYSSGITAMSGGQGYLNGVANGAAFTMGARPASEITIASDRYVPNYLAATVAAVSLYSTTLSADDHADLKNRMAGLA